MHIRHSLYRLVVAAINNTFYLGLGKRITGLGQPKVKREIDRSSQIVEP